MCFSHSESGFDWKAWGRKGPGRWSVFERGDLKFVILRLLAEKPMHGYEVMRAIEEESCGWYKASAGSIYPTLQLLEDQGYLRSEETEGKKVYHLTDEGRAYLDDNRQQIDDIFERIQEFTNRFFGQDMRDLTDSFAKLAEETFRSATSWVEDSGFMQQMRDILDQAAGKMADARRHAKQPTDEPANDVTESDAESAVADSGERKPAEEV